MREEGPETRRRLILQWQQPIYSYAFRMIGNEPDAADLTQEIFTRALANQDHFQLESIQPWPGLQRRQ